MHSVYKDPKGKEFTLTKPQATNESGVRMTTSGPSQAELLAEITKLKAQLYQHQNSTEVGLTLIPSLFYGKALIYYKLFLAVHWSIPDNYETS